MIYDNESYEMLGIGNLAIIQSSTQYRFTTDAVLLANVVSGVAGKKVADLGCGSGIISILLSVKKHARHVTGIELQPQLADMARRSVAHNNLQDAVDIVCGNMLDVCKQYAGTMDCVVCNPPYRKLGSGKTQLEDHLAICRHEIAIDLAGVIASGAKMLNTRGSMYIVHQSCRLAEICYTYKQYGIEPKDIYPICTTEGKPPSLVIVRGVLGGAVDTIVHNTIVICDKQGNYTPLVASYYDGEVN